MDLARATSCVPFVDWAASMDPSLEVRGVHVSEVDMFGARVGFLKMRADVRRDGVEIPGIVFCRGGAVAILPLLTCGGERFVVCCRQPRVPIGAAAFLEIPAGMLDGEGDFVGVAVKELQEETGLTLEARELVDLSALAWGARAGVPAPRGLYPSVGACDEHLRLLLYARSCSPEELASLRGRATGNLAEGEVITLDVVPLVDLWRHCSDAKTLAALYLLEKLEAQGVVTVPSEGRAAEGPERGAK